MQLDEQVLALLSGAGVALVVGSANEERAPEICRAWGPRFVASDATLEVMLPMPAASTTLRNLATSSAVAFTFSKPTDYSAFQVKGERVEVRDLQAHEWRRARNHFDAFLVEASEVGLSPAAYAPWFPAEGQLLVARIDRAYCQAPGPKAGTPL